MIQMTGRCPVPEDGGSQNSDTTHLKNYGFNFGYNPTEA